MIQVLLDSVQSKEFRSLVYPSVKKITHSGKQLKDHSYVFDKFQVSAALIVLIFSVIYLKKKHHYKHIT